MGLLANCHIGDNQDLWLEKELKRNCSEELKKDLSRVQILFLEECLRRIGLQIGILTRLIAYGMR